MSPLALVLVLTWTTTAMGQGLWTAGDAVDRFLWAQGRDPDVVEVVRRIVDHVEHHASWSAPCADVTWSLREVATTPALERASILMADITAALEHLSYRVPVAEVTPGTWNCGTRCNNDENDHHRLYACVSVDAKCTVQVPRFLVCWGSTN